VPQLLLIAPALIAAVSLFLLMGRERDQGTSRMLEFAALAATAAAALAIVTLGTTGARSGALGALPVSVRLDVVAVTLFALVSVIGWGVVRYAGTYLDGAPRRAVFLGWLGLTLASVMLLVLAGDLVQLVAAWILTSLFLHRLLLFYPERAGARRAARKKFVTARASDLLLIGAALLLTADYGSTDIATILADARSGEGSSLSIIAAVLLALSAMLKSAQFPLHGWLTEVMETPTPVSALLHAGVINAGGFLLIRFADVLLLAPGVLAMLTLVGGFTALFGALVMLTQPAVKTSLAWSTVAQMGFMIMQCGLALFPLALLHIVAHSLYKAHAFLASGGAVERIAAARRPGPVAVPDGWAVVRAFVAALAVFGVCALVFGFADKPPQAVALGAILIFGVAYLFAQGLAGAAPRGLTIITAANALAVSLGYFALQTAAETLTRGTLPPPPEPGPLSWALLILAMLSFGLVAIAQALFPLWSHHPAAAGLRTHLANGLYANALFDRVLGAWRQVAAAPVRSSAA
jgi:NAD(P)H-quinone oxidoreductase subunit 5